MAVLDNIAGTILEDTFIYSGGDDPLGGMVSASVVDDNNTLLGSQSIGNRRKADLEAILTAGNYDPFNLTNEVKSKAQLALNWACIHDFYDEGTSGMPIGQKNGLTADTRRKVMMRFKHKVCTYLKDLNLFWDDYCTTAFLVKTVTSKKHCESDHNHGYSSNNIKYH